MSTINRSDVQAQLRNKEIDVRTMRENDAIPEQVKAQLVRADQNGDGVIAGTNEVNRLFDAADNFDRNGNRNSIATERGGAPTPAAQGITAAVAQAKPRRGLTSPNMPVPTETTTPTRPGQRTGLDDNFRQFREVDVNALRDQLPAQAKHLAQSFVDDGRRHNVDPLLLASISKHETANWTSSAFRNKNNAMGVSNSRGPIRMASHDASIERMASLVGSTTSGPYKSANTYRELWGIYAPGPATGQGRQSNDPNNLNRHWGPNIIANIDRYSAALR